MSWVLVRAGQTRNFWGGLLVQHIGQLGAKPRRTLLVGCLKFVLMHLRRSIRLASDGQGWRCGHDVTECVPASHETYFFLSTLDAQITGGHYHGPPVTRLTVE